MLNYIWAGLIIFSLVFAFSADVGALRKDKFRNGRTLAVTVTFPQGESSAVKKTAQVRIDPATYQAIYGVAPKLPESYAVTIDQRDLRFAPEAEFPEPLAKVRTETASEDKRLRATVMSWKEISPTTAEATLLFPTVRFVTMKAVGTAAIDMARMAVELALKLVGVLALWLGLARIGEKAGLIEAMVKLFQPLLRPLFPGIPRDHPALAMVALNLTANFLGLGNAATPFGIKAMEKLQELNRRKDTATNSMVMFLAMNTAGVQLVPPALLIAVTGMKSTEYIFPIWIVTFLSLVIGIIAAKVLGMLPGYRRSDPDRLPPGETDAGDAGSAGGTGITAPAV